MTRESAIEIVIEHPALAALPYWQQMATVGVPPHVTLLYPWRSGPVDDASLDALRTVVHQCVPFSLTLGRVASFPRGVVYATVEPDAPIRWMIDAIVELFPDTPPLWRRVRLDGTRAALHARQVQARSGRISSFGVRGDLLGDPPDHDSDHVSCRRGRIGHGNVGGHDHRSPRVLAVAPYVPDGIRLKCPMAGNLCWCDGA